MSNFTAIDFETATSNRNSVCQIGLVVVEQCKIVERIKYFVKPPGNIYHQANVNVHGIHPSDTLFARTFGEIFQDVKHLIAPGKNLVAHSAEFEMSCLSKSLLEYGIATPRVNWYCTRKIYKLSLAEACKKMGITYIPHDALEDAEAAAWLMIKDILR